MSTRLENEVLSTPEETTQDVEVVDQHPQDDTAINGEESPAEVDEVEVDEQTQQKKGRKERTAKQLAKFALAAIDRVTGNESADLMLRRAESWQGTVDVLNEEMSELKSQLQDAKGIRVKKVCSDGVQLQNMRDTIQKKLDELESGDLALSPEEQAFLDSALTPEE